MLMEKEEFIILMNSSFSDCIDENSPLQILAG